jgi:hypothetical protein
VFCSLHKDSNYNNDNRQVILKNKNDLHLSHLNVLQKKFPSISFYGVDNSVPQDRIDEEFSDFEDIEDFIQSKIIDNKNIDYIKIKFALTNSHLIDNKSLNHLAKINNLIQDNKSFFIQHGGLQKKIKDIIATDSGMLHIYESIKGVISEKELKSFVKDNPEYDLEKSKKQCAKTYPLLEYISIYDYTNIVNHLAQYINLIDKV